MGNNNNENGEIPSVFKKLQPWLKLAGGILSLVVIVGGGIWTLNSTYASKGYVKAVEINAEKGRILLAEESVKTLQQFQTQMRQEQTQNKIKSDIRYWTQLIDSTYDKINDLNNQLRIQPNNVYLKNRLGEEKNKLNKYRQKLDKLLSN
ncbi:MAG: hypothetical protein ACFFG0_02155 [Candidatus Thorarchaeota archaeon]